ncbi:hypothetical protein IC229_05390 [Spirosoma sp. BT702]|uniref:Uncharacterized protein n=1 Tax=Spirosoma profusum TaxID=2771354 RepID=A0A926XTJ9_9BACT|nr:hypothetical protein [Spirosoma profusum]MBD2700058.1 hypothetical protein [Spirosoma profusum]
MKTIVIIGILLVGLSGQAMSMGHPHNVFAARKQLRSKPCVSNTKSKIRASAEWKPAVKTAKAAISERLLTVFTHLRPLRSY